MKNSQCEGNVSEFTEEQFEKTYSKILTNVLDGYCSSAAPYALVLGGQPGSGKTVIQEMATSKDTNLVAVNGDDFRKYHPNIEAINKLSGDSGVGHTQKFANVMVERLVDALSEQKYNILIEGTLRTAAVPLNTCRLLKARGYRVELSVMAVDKKMSWQGTIDRYNRMKAIGVTPRSTPKENHDFVVSVLPCNLNVIYKSGEFDRITLYDRSCNTLYDSAETPDISPVPILSAVLNGEVDVVRKTHKKTAGVGKQVADHRPQHSQVSILDRLNANKSIISLRDTEMGRSVDTKSRKKHGSMEQE